MHTHIQALLTAEEMSKHKEFKYKVKTYLGQVLDSKLESESTSNDLTTSDGLIYTWKALAGDVKVGLFDAVIERWETSRNTLLASDAKSDPDTADMVREMIEEDYIRWRNRQNAKRRKGTSIPMCRQERGLMSSQSRRNQYPSKPGLQYLGQKGNRRTSDHASVLSRTCVVGSLILNRIRGL